MKKKLIKKYFLQASQSTIHGADYEITLLHIVFFFITYTKKPI